MRALIAAGLTVGFLAAVVVFLSFPQVVASIVGLAILYWFMYIVAGLVWG